MNDEIRIIDVGLSENGKQYIEDVAAALGKSVEEVEADFKNIKCIMLDDDPYKETMKMLESFRLQENYMPTITEPAPHTKPKFNRKTGRFY